MKKITLYIAILLLVAFTGTTESISLNNDLAFMNNISHNVLCAAKLVGINMI